MNYDYDLAAWRESVEGTKGYAEGVERDEQSGALRAVQVDGKRVAADCVVLAMGPWSPTWFGLPQAYGTKYHSLLMRPARTLSQCVFFDCTGAALCGNQGRYG